MMNRPRKRMSADVVTIWLRLLARSQDIFFTGTTMGVVYYQNTHAVYFLCASLATAFIAKGLKHVFRQPRPDGSKKSTYGMPSTHCASTGTFACFYLADLLLKLEAPVVSAWALTARPVLVPTLLLLPALVVYSRVRLGMHTVVQCMAGVGLGCISVPLFTSLWDHLGCDVDPTACSLRTFGLDRHVHISKNT